MLKRDRLNRMMRLFLALMMVLPQGLELAAEETEEPEETVSEYTEGAEEILEEELILEEDPEEEEEAPAEELPEEEDEYTEEEGPEEVPEEETEPEDEISTGEIVDEVEVTDPEETPEEVPAEEEHPLVTLSQSHAELVIGETLVLEAAVSGAGEEVTVVWSSSDEEVAAVDENGTVTALQEGVAGIRASVLDGTVFAEALVRVVSAEPGRIEFSQKSYEVFTGETVTVSYTLAEGDHEDIVWTVDEEGLVEIDTETEGEVTVAGIESGVVHVNAQLGDASSSFTVIVLSHYEEEYDEEPAGMMSEDGTVVTGKFTVGYRQSSARELAASLNYYRWNTANIAVLAYDYTIEKYAMRRAAELAVAFSHTRPNGKDWKTVMGDTDYRNGGTVNENLLYSGDGSMSTAAQVLSRVLADNNQRSKSLRTTNKSIGVGHAVYNGIDYWVMIFCDINAKNVSPTSAVDWDQDASVLIRSELYSNPGFSSSKSVIKLNVKQTVSLPSISGKVNVVLGGQTRTIPFTGFSVTWSLDTAAKKYVSLTSDGKLKAGSEPNNNETAYTTAKITMNGSTYSVKVQVKVIQPVTGVSVSPTSANVDLGKTVKLAAVVKPDNATDKSVTWKSSNTKIATVNSNGLVTAKKGGSCTITVTTNDGGFKATSKITVIVHPTNIAFQFSELTMTLDMTDKLIPVFTPKDTTDQKVTFTSSDTSKVKVAADGTVTALKLTGDTPVTITMKSHDGGLEAELPVTVKDKDRVRPVTGTYLWENQYEITLFEYEGSGDEFVNTLLKGDPIRLHTDTKDAVIYYTVDGSTPTTDSTRYTDMIRYTGGEFTLKALAVKRDQLKDSEITEFRIGESEEPVWEILDEDREKLWDEEEGVYKVPAGLWAAGIDETAVYTGGKIRFPDLRVYYRNRMLAINKDYKVAYKNNVNVCYPEESKACTVSYKDNGSYVPAKNTKVSYITITGKGNYKGSTYVPFRIEPVAISEENGFSYQAELYRSIGTKALNPVPVILWNGKKLKHKTDFVVAYSRDAAGTEVLEGGITEPGDYYAIVSGIRNYTAAENRIAVPVHVKAEAVLLSTATIKIGNVEYTGGPIDPDTLNITVKAGKKVLEKGIDYVIDRTLPENPTEIGTVKLTIKAKEDSPYIGEKTGTFKITGRSIAKATVYCLNPAVTYTGSTFTLAELYKANPKRPDLTGVSLLRNGEVLQEGVDYTVTVSGQNKGKGTVRFKGIGAYTGTVTKKFTINPKQLTRDDIYIYLFDMNFTKTGAKPEVFVFLKTDPDDPSGYEFTDGVYGRIMDEKKEYSLKYFNNKKIYTDDTFKTKNAPSVSVIMKGNFKGTFANNHFLIMSEDISWMRINCSDSLYGASKKGSQNYVKPTIYDYEGKKLVLNKDYKLTYYYAQDAKVNGSTTYNRAYGTALRATDVPEPGTVIAVEATGIGSYYGTLRTEYKVIKKAASLSSSKVTVNYQNGKKKYFEYTGSQIIPAAENLKVVLGKKTLVYGVDYEIKSISNNIKAGKATMVIRGIGDYGGTKKVVFTIGKQSLVLDIGSLLRSVLGMSY